MIIPFTVTTPPSPHLKKPNISSQEDNVLAYSSEIIKRLSVII
jgi:hypothetical protein